MHVMTILGTRPEIIRLSRIIPLLDNCCTHTFVHTGQNYDDRLSKLFFDELDLRNPCYSLDVRGEGFGAQVGAILERCEQVLASSRPDRVLVLGDTNSALSAVVAKRLGIPVFHMEAGNRCYDDRVPEEINRRIVDHCSDVLLPYTERSRANLLAEGLPSQRIFVTGNPIGEIINHHRAAIDASPVLDDLGIQSGQYFLATLHRAENVDPAGRCRLLLDSLVELTSRYRHPVILSVHPRLKTRLALETLELPSELRLCPPFGFHDFVKLERHAMCVLSDSGTVQEECTILRVPSVTLRDVTERPETQECGANILAGAQTDAVLHATALATNTPTNWISPPEYLREDVAETVVKIVTGYHHGIGRS